MRRSAGAGLMPARRPVRVAPGAARWVKPLSKFPLEVVSCGLRRTWSPARAPDEEEAARATGKRILAANSRRNRARGVSAQAARRAARVLEYPVGVCVGVPLENSASIAAGPGGWSGEVVLLEGAGGAGWCDVVHAVESG